MAMMHGDVDYSFYFKTVYYIISNVSKLKSGYDL